jgi:Sterol desaturase
LAAYAQTCDRAAVIVGRNGTEPATGATFMDFMTPWPAIFAFDLGRYLLTAMVISGVLLLIPAGAVALRRVRDRLPRANQRWHELRHSVVATGVFSLVGLGVYHGAQHGLFRVYSQPAQYGWMYWAASLVLVIVAHDAYFYWAHRWMHRPSVFRRAHRTHHLSVAPTQWAAYSFSVSEAALQAAFLPLFLLVVPTHSTVLLIWMAHQVVRNVAGHCGVELEPRAWLATWWGRWFTTTLHHDMHHEHGRYNYGLYFAWWDRWCGTEHPDYRRRLASLLSSIEDGRALQPRATEV